MKVLAVTLLALVAVANSKNINIGNVIDLEDLTAYGYHTKVGIPLATEIRKAEAQLAASKIAGGSAATLGQFPYQVGIIIDLERDQSVCGGSILTNRKVVTAAHCWYDGDSSQAWRFTVIAGSTLLFSGGQRIQTSNVVMHGSWNPSLIVNDIAMITLDPALILGHNVAAIALPTGSELSENFAGDTAIASGFGRTGDSFAGAISTNQFLSHVNLSVITNAECRQSFPSHVKDSNICTSGAGGRNICSGDSGGPLVVTRNNRRILIGITSFGSGLGCELEFPSGFTRITSFIDWIYSQL